MIQVLVGPIASGKSTYAQNAARNGFICVNDDAVVNLIHANEYTLYDKSLKILYKSVENHVVGTALAMGKRIVADRGLNISFQGRKRWISLANSFDVPCVAVLFEDEGPEIHAQRRSRSNSRGRTYEQWLEVALHHQKQYQEPTMEEGFVEVHRISYEEILSGKIIF